MPSLSKQEVLEKYYRGNSEENVEIQQYQTLLRLRLLLLLRTRTSAGTRDVSDAERQRLRPIALTRIL